MSRTARFKGLSGQGGEHGVAVGRGFHSKTMLAQVVGQQIADIRIVVHHQQGRALGLLGGFPAGTGGALGIIGACVLSSIDGYCSIAGPALTSYEM